MNGESKRLESSLLLNSINEFMTEVVKYPANVIENMKEKRERAVVAGSNITWSAHNVFSETVARMEVSALLACNENIVPHYIEEAGQFAGKLRYLKAATSKIKHVQELQKYYGSKWVKLKEKDVLSGLIADLKEWSAEDGYPIDIKAIRDEFERFADKSFENELKKPR